jgi:hypothetical protein
MAKVMAYQATLTGQQQKGQKIERESRGRRSSRSRA